MNLPWCWNIPINLSSSCFFCGGGSCVPALTLFSSCLHQFWVCIYFPLFWLSTYFKFEVLLPCSHGLFWSFPRQASRPQLSGRPLVPGAVGTCITLWGVKSFFKAHNTLETSFSASVFYLLSSNKKVLCTLTAAHPTWRKVTHCFFSDFSTMPQVIQKIWIQFFVFHFQQDWTGPPESSRGTHWFTDFMQLYNLVLKIKFFWNISPVTPWVYVLIVRSVLSLSCKCNISLKCVQPQFKTNGTQ